LTLLVRQVSDQPPWRRPFDDFQPAFLRPRSC
jgi:hypothetical protein